MLGQPDQASFKSLFISDGDLVPYHSLPTGSASPSLGCSQTSLIVRGVDQPVMMNQFEQQVVASKSQRPALQAQANESSTCPYCLIFDGL